ncbi:hypothetical protein M9Y10_044502 [Tritrichomonas musculus]|uniref:Uncharacterized protein n=1 Tax=Tritrichomonas musculus TaxID=1915356 RepID=A0ABR2JSW7_9EUKA
MINKQVGEEIEPGATKAVSVNHLLPYLNENNFSFFEGKVVNKDTIQNFINRLNNKRTQFGINPIQLYRRTRKEPLLITPDVKRKLDFKTTHDALNNSGIIPGLKHGETLATINNEYYAVPEPQDVVYMSMDELEELVNNENEQQRNNQSVFLLNSQMNQQENVQLLDDLINKYDEISITPFPREQLRGNPQQNLQLILRKFAEIQTRAASQGRATSKKGMNELARIVLDLQRDVKRVAKAISPQGAQEMVEQHNAKYQDKPQSQWRFQHADANGDNIPDVVIRNANNEPLYVMVIQQPRVIILHVFHIILHILQVEQGEKMQKLE